MMSASPQTERSAPSDHWTAAEFTLKLESGRDNAQVRAQLEAWLQADPSHQQAWAQVCGTLALASAHAADPELMVMRRAALAARGRPTRRWPLAIAAGLALSIPLGALWLTKPWPGPAPAPTPASAAAVHAAGTVDPGQATYRTALGERAAITLPDGSVATLDTDSVIRLNYSAHSRAVRLLRGQALFEVAKHRPQPFEVTAGDRRITAVGTKFNVRVFESPGRPEVDVALLEGVVRVARIPSGRGGAPTEEVVMAAGELLETAAARPMRVTAADTDRLTSWRAGVLTFDDAPLGYAVEELNRYTSRKVLIGDRGLAHMHVSGVFKTGDPDHVAETLAEALPLVATPRDDGNIELSRKP